MRSLIIIFVNFIFLIHTIIHIDSISWKPFIGLYLLNTVLFILSNFVQADIFDSTKYLIGGALLTSSLLTGVVTVIIAIFYLFFI